MAGPEDQPIDVDPQGPLVPVQAPLSPEARAGLALEIARRLEGGLGQPAPAPVSNLGRTGSFRAPLGNIAQEQATALGRPELGPVQKYPGMYGGMGEPELPVPQPGEVTLPETTITPGVGGGGPPPVTLPAEFRGKYGNRIFPPDYLERIKSLPPDQQALAIAKYNEAQESRVGILGRGAEREAKGATERFGLAEGLASEEQKIGERVQYGQGIAQLHEQRMRQEEQMHEQARHQADENMRFRIEEADRRAADFKIDPNRLWRQQGGGALFLSTLGVALAEFGRAFTGGQRNVALEMMNAAVERDIDAQKNEVWRLRDDVAAKRNMYGMLRQVHQDDRLAEAQTRKHLWEAFSAYAAEQQGLAGDVRKKALIEEARSFMNEKIDMSKLAVEDVAAGVRDAEAAARARALAASAAATQKAKLLERLGGARPLDAEQVRRLIPGYGLAVTGSRKSIEEAQTAAKTVAGTRRNYAELYQLLQDPTNTLTPTGRAELKQAIAHIRNPELAAFGGKVLTLQEMERKMEEFGFNDPESITERTLKDIEKLARKHQATVEAGVEDAMRSLGVRDVETFDAPDIGAKDPLTAPYKTYVRERVPGEVVPGRTGIDPGVVKPGYANVEGN